MKTDFLVVGAGLSGAVIAERVAAVLKKEVLVIDKREHLAGNVYDYRDENGIVIHRYGPHAFHTNNKMVWDYLSGFTKWHMYSHKVHAIVDGREIPLPFNINSLYELFPSNLASRLEDRLIATYGYDVKVPILRLKKSTNKDLGFLSKFIYEKIFLGYTLKQWGLRPEELDTAVTARVPVLVGRDNRYFQDKYQGIPEAGYTTMIKNMLDSPRIKVQLGYDFKKVNKKVKCGFVVYTGAIDDFFDYKYGVLPYRSLDFRLRSYDREYFQSVAQVNYPEDYDFTRITEFKHFLGVRSDRTTIAYEYPQEFIRGENEPYYPVPRKENSKKFNVYAREARRLKNVIFLGRLADYRYYNMDEAVERALEVFEKKLSLLK